MGISLQLNSFQKDWKAVCGLELSIPDIAVSACCLRNAQLFEYSPDNYFKQSHKQYSLYGS